VVHSPYALLASKGTAREKKHFARGSSFKKSKSSVLVGHRITYSTPHTARLETNLSRPRVNLTARNRP